MVCYQNYEHIFSTFNALKNDFSDFLIIENKSINSEVIKDFFLKQEILKYIFFEDNIAGNAVNIFLKDFSEIIKQYEYITITDADLKVDDSKKTFEEIFSILDLPEVGVCCVDLDMANLPDVPGAKQWVAPVIEETELYYTANTGIHLMTIRNENIGLIEDIHFLDSLLSLNITKKNKKWVKTKKNKAVHLTWDLYFPGSPYYEYKLKNKDLWNKIKHCKYQILK